MEQAHIDFHGEVLASLARLETNMVALVGNGQPGRMTKAEDNIKEINSQVNKLYNKLAWWTGAAVGVSTVIGALVHFVFRY